MTPFQHRFAAARLWAASRFPYLASALFAIQVVESEVIDGVAVDAHWNLYANPGTTEARSIGELGSMLVHHAGHLLRDHASRARDIDTVTLGQWTLAADVEINDDLAHDLELPGSMPRPVDIGAQPRLFAEAYYQHLLRTPFAGTCDCGSGADGQRRAWDRDDLAHFPRARSHLVRCQVAAEILKGGKSAGLLPQGLVRWAREYLGVTLDWRAVLRGQVTRSIELAAGSVDFSYSRPSRRAQQVAPAILPRLVRPAVSVAIVVDTSQSVDENALGRALAEIHSVIKASAIGGRRVTVLSCDSQVHWVRRITSGRQVELLGGGGTDMAKGIHAAHRLNPRPNVIIALTDGETPWPTERPKGSHVVIGLLGDAHGANAPTWARVVHIGQDQSRWAS